MKSGYAFLESVQHNDMHDPISIDELDVLLMRNDPADDVVERPWAVTSGVLFGQLSVARGTLVVNDPMGLSQALNKLYFHAFPREVRPETLVTRDPDEVRTFVVAHGGKAIVKPLQIKPYPTPRAIANSYEIALAEYPGGEGLNPLALWDIHWVKQADDSGFIEDLIARMA